MGNDIRVAENLPQNSGNKKHTAKNFLFVFALFIIPFVTYYKTTGFDFIYSWDDHIYVVYNSQVHGFSLDNLLAIFTQPIISNYFPIQLLSYSFDYSIWELDPYGYHLTNVLLHSINVVLAYFVLHRFTQHKSLSFFVALVFAVHPLNVEVVAWVSQRKSLLSALFFFSTLLFYLSWKENGRRYLYMFSVIAFMLSVFSKTTTVILPVLLLCHAYWESSLSKKTLLFVVPYFLISIAGAVGTIMASLAGKALDSSTLTWDVLVHLIYPTMLPVYVKYLSLLVWPMDLSAFYDTTIYHTFFAFPVVLSALFWVAIIISVFIWGNRQQKFWFSWAVLCFLPVSNILPIQVYYADRFLYLPQIGFFAFLAFTTISVTMLFKKRFNIAGDPTRVYSILAFAILSALAVTTTKRANVWENEITLWEDTVEKSPGLDGPHVNLGSAYERVGRYDGAIVQYEEAMKIYSNGEAARKLRALKARLMSGKNAD